MRDKTIAALLAIFLGGIGIHKFYLGHTGRGIAYLLFCWTFIPAIIAFCSAIKLLCMNHDDFNVIYNTENVKQNVNEVDDVEQTTYHRLKKQMDINNQKGAE